MINILIVDDDNLTRAALKKFISQQPVCKVYEVNNGDKALELIKDETIDIAFIDSCMPRKSGIETIRNIRQINQNMTIIIMSSYHNANLAYQAIQYQVAKCLIKPIELHQIRDIISGYEKSNQHTYDMSYEINRLVSRVELLIRNGKFYEAYEAIQALTKSMLVNKPSDYRIKMINEFVLRIWNSLFPNLMDVYDEMMAHHELTIGIVTDNRLLNIWLFKILDYIFRQVHGQQNEILTSVINYIDQNIYSDISLKDIVQGCNVSQGHISRIFKMKFDMTVMQYIHNKKLTIAKEYLCMTTLHGTELAVKLGYNDFSYFCKIFRKYEDMTISQYRGYAH